jgi:hypothetical protein
VGWCKFYPLCVSTPIDEASISLIFRKIPVMVRCMIASLERGEGFAQFRNFQTSWVSPTPYACQPKNKDAKTPRVNFSNLAGPQTKLRTGRKLPVLYYISYGYIFPHTNHHRKKSARAVGAQRLAQGGPQGGRQRQERARVAQEIARNERHAWTILKSTVYCPQIHY